MTRIFVLCAVLAGSAWTIPPPSLPYVPPPPLTEDVSLCGQVMDTAGAPIAGANVGLKRQPLSSRSDSNGYWCLQATVPSIVRGPSFLRSRTPTRLFDLLGRPVTDVPVVPQWGGVDILRREAEIPTDTIIADTMVFSAYGYRTQVIPITSYSNTDWVAFMQVVGFPYIWNAAITPGNRIYTPQGSGGYWYPYSDADADSGSSTVEFTSDDYDHLQALFTTGPGFDFPFAGITFDWVHPSQGGPLPFDISTRSGVRVTYNSNCRLELRLRWDESAYGYDVYRASLHSTASSYRTVDILFSTFRQEGWGARHPLLTATTESLGMVIQYGAAAGGSCSLKVYELEWLN